MRIPERGCFSADLEKGKRHGVDGKSRRGKLGFERLCCICRMTYGFKGRRLRLHLGRPHGWSACMVWMGNQVDRLMGSGEIAGEKIQAFEGFHCPL